MTAEKTIKNENDYAPRMSDGLLLCCSRAAQIRRPFLPPRPLHDRHHRGHHAHVSPAMLKDAANLLDRVPFSELLRVRYGLWRERVGIEPTSRLTTTSTILKTVRATRPVRSHEGEKPYFLG